MKKLSETALIALGSVEVDGQLVRLAPMDRQTYLIVNEALEALGGKWNRKAKAHVFENGPRDVLDQVVLTGGFCDKKQDFCFFETPAPLADRMVQLARIEPGMIVLEPSAGRGRLIQALDRALPGSKLACDVTAVELLAENVNQLSVMGNLRSGYTRIVQDDFMVWTPAMSSRFDRVLMNPPFSRQQDIDHVTRAFPFLAPGGRLVAIMSAGVMFRDNKKTADFRKLVFSTQNSLIEPLPDGAFKESGTDVCTCIVTLDK